MEKNKEDKNKKDEEKVKKATEEKPTEEKVEEAKVEEKKEEPKEKPKKEEKKKTEAGVNAFDIPISTKHSAAICKFIKNKKIPEAIADLEQVIRFRKAVPMKGEIPHRKGKIMSGRFPKKAAREFIILLKSLAANTIYNGLENPIITEAVANIGARPYGRDGVRRKRTHIRIVAKDKQISHKKKRKNKGKK